MGMAGPQKVVIVDDHPILISALANLFETQIENVAVTAMPHDAEPDFSDASLVMIDIYLQGRSGLELITKARTQHHAPVIVAMSGDDSWQTQYDAFAAGANAFIAKSAETEKVIELLRFLLGRAATIPALLDTGLALGQPAIRPPKKAQADLSSREREIVMLIGQGLNNEAIAKELHLSVNTVKQHVTRLLAAHGAENRTQLLNALLQNGLPGGPMVAARDNAASDA